MTAGDPPPSEPSRAGRNRRGVLLLGLALVTYAGVSSLIRRSPRAEYAEIDGLPGFRRLEAGATTAPFDPFIGLDAGDPALRPRASVTAAVRSAPCQALFAGGWGGSVPVAVFTDYNCPICRASEADVETAVAASNGRARLIWHELPLLGDTSVAAARLALAARRLGAYDDFRARLMRSRFVADAAYGRALAASVGLDPDQLLAIAASDAVTQEIETALALAGLLALPGTPSMAIGGTVVVGALPQRRIRELIGEEARRGPPAACMA